MPVAHPEEFRRRAVELARTSGQSIAKISKDLGINEQTLRNWLSRADVDEGREEGLTGDERKELVRLRRENRVLAMEVEILKKASAIFARDGLPGPK
jgi:transposase